MNILILKKWFFRVSVWLRHYWYIPVIVLMIPVTYLIFGGKNRALIELFSAKRKDYKEQVNKIDKIYKNLLEEKAENLKTFQDKMEEVASTTETKRLEVRESKKKHERELESKSIDELAKEMKKEFDL